MTRLTSEPSNVNGRCLSHGQLRQLQWIVPRPWAPEVISALGTLPLASARVRACLAGAEHWIGFFEGARMVEEALRPAAQPLLSERGLLPIGGCGKRGASLYFIEVTRSDSGLWYGAQGAAPEALGLGLWELWAAAQPEPRVQLRRRLPAKSPRRLAKTEAGPRPPGAATACGRTLPLFA